MWCIQKVITKSHDNDKADEVIQEFFQSILSRNQIGLETSMKSSNSKVALNR